MLQKVRNGGWPAFAPVGYQNVRDTAGRRSESRLVSDPDTAPLVRQAFDLYASGKWTLTRPHEEMVSRGLRAHRGSLITRSQFAAMLRNKIYAGTIVWGGFEVPGTHEPLVGEDVFRQVERIFRLYDPAQGVRSRKHAHYLTGLLYCASCGSRLCLTVSKGRSNHCAYFFCVGRARRRVDCSETYLPLTVAEKLIADFYRLIRFPESKIARIRELMEVEIATQEVGRTNTAEEIAKSLGRLTAQKEKLLHAYYSDAISIALLRTEQKRIEGEAQALKGRQAVDLAKLEDARELAERAMRLLAICHRVYQTALPDERRRWNQLLFKRVYVGEEQVKRFEYRELFRELLVWAREDESSARTGHGSNKEALVDRTGQFSNR